MRRTGWPHLVLVACVLVAHSLRYDFVTDDAYIAFVYARNVAEHGQLAYNLGDAVEGTTSFLWTVILAAGMKLGVLPEVSSRLLGTACGVAGLFAAYRLTERALARPSPWALLPPTLLACASGYACWSSGGLETQLFTLLCTLAIDAYLAGAFAGCGALLAFAAMTRPEGLLVAAVIGGHRVVWILGRRSVDVHEKRGLATFLLVWAPWFLWRWTHYGWLFPNTFYVKATGAWTDPRLPAMLRAHGLHYVWTFLWQTGLLWALPVAAVGVVATPRTPRFTATTVLLTSTVAYLTYAVSVGGDFMGLHRFILPVFVWAAILVTLGLEALLSRIAEPRRRRFGAAAAVAVAVAFAVSQARLTAASTNPANLANDHGIDTPAFLNEYAADRAAIGRAMRDCFRPDDFAIVGGAGAQPYEAHLRAVDVFGLVSDRIAHEMPRSSARPGHLKRGDDATLWSYAPDFDFACYDLTDSPDEHREMKGCEAFWFDHGFERVTMKFDGLREGSYYTFLASKARNFQCPGRVY